MGTSNLKEDPKKMEDEPQSMEFEDIEYNVPILSLETYNGILNDDVKTMSMVDEISRSEESSFLNELKKKIDCWLEKHLVYFNSTNSLRKHQKISFRGE
jgi:hypothetical protein